MMGTLPATQFIHSPAVMTVKNYAAISVSRWRLLSVGREFSDLYHKRHESPVIQNEEETPTGGGT